MRTALLRNKAQKACLGVSQWFAVLVLLDELLLLALSRPNKHVILARLRGAGVPWNLMAQHAMVATHQYASTRSVSAIDQISGCGVFKALENTE